MKKFVLCAFFCLVTGLVFAQNYNDQLVIAAWKSDMSALRYAMRMGANVNHMFNERTALMDAVAQQNSSMVNVLLMEYGANASFQNIYGDNALIMAVSPSVNNITIARLLISAGANIHTPNLQGMTPLMVAAKSRNSDIVDWLMDSGARIRDTSLEGRDALIYAVLEDDNYFVVTRLLQRIDINTSQADVYGKTAFIYAVEHERLDIVRLFLQSRRFDVNRLSGDEISPLLYAIQNKLSFNMIENIIENSAFDGAKDPDGRGIAQYFNRYDSGNTRLRDLLVSRGVDLNVEW